MLVVSSNEGDWAMSRQGVLLRFVLPGLLCSLAFVVLSPSQAQTTKRKGFALLVGVREYDHAGLTALKYPERDVEELAKLLDRPASPFHGRVRLLTNKRGEKNKDDLPTAANIRKALAELVAKPIRHDTVLLALAGHGGEVSVEDPVGSKPKKIYPYFF